MYMYIVHNYYAVVVSSSIAMLTYVIIGELLLIAS